MDWRDKKQSSAPKKKIVQLQSWQNFYSFFYVTTFALCMSSENWKKRAFGAWAYVDQFMYVCDCITRCYRLRPKIWTMLSKYEIR